MLYSFLESPVGPLLLAGSDDRLRLIGFSSGPKAQAPHGDWIRRNDCVVAAKRQLGEYFEGTRREFDLNLAPAGTDFQLRVWRALSAIPYGETRSYGEIADAIGNPRAAMAVGGANGSNPLPIVVPCHRVIGSDGTLTGFGGGLAAKRYLLDLESGNGNVNPCGSSRTWSPRSDR